MRERIVGRLCKTPRRSQKALNQMAKLKLTQLVFGALMERLGRRRWKRSKGLALGRVIGESGKLSTGRKRRACADGPCAGTPQDLGENYGRRFRQRPRRSSRMAVRDLDLAKCSSAENLSLRCSAADAKKLGGESKRRSGIGRCRAKSGFTRREEGDDASVLKRRSSKQVEEHPMRSTWPPLTRFSPSGGCTRRRRQLLGNQEKQDTPTASLTDRVRGPSSAGDAHRAGRSALI